MINVNDNNYIDEQFWELNYLETMDGVPVLLTWSSLSESKVWEVVIFCWTSELVWQLFEVAATDDIAVSCENKNKFLSWIFKILDF